MHISERAFEICKSRDMFKGKIVPADPNDSNNPYLAKDGKWYWWDDSEQAHGPHETEQDAETHLVVYIYGLGE